MPVKFVWRMLRKYSSFMNRLVIMSAMYLSCDMIEHMTKHKSGEHSNDGTGKQIN